MHRAVGFLQVAVLTQIYSEQKLIQTEENPKAVFCISTLKIAISTFEEFGLLKLKIAYIALKTLNTGSLLLGTKLGSFSFLQDTLKKSM